MAEHAVTKWVQGAFPPSHLNNRTDGDIVVPIASVLVAFGGVLCVALEGFPSPVAQFKSTLSTSCHGDLAPELMGSKWAKVTVAAVRDDALGGAMDPAVWDRLRSALLLWNALPAVHAHSGALLRDLSVVHFLCRSLAKHDVVASVPLGCLGTSDVTSMDPESRAKGAEVVSEFAAEGNWSTYRDHGILSRLQPASSYHQACEGSTIVAFLVKDCWADILEHLKRHLEEHDLGWLYDWMPKEVLHVTVRGL
jgi:hypothetical protein